MDRNIFDQDDYGRFFRDKFGNKIYKRLDDSEEKFRIGNKMVPVQKINHEFKVILNTEDDDASDFIVKHLKNALVEGLVDVFIKKPSDPIGHLAHCLLLYRRNELSEILIQNKRKTN